MYHLYNDLRQILCQRKLLTWQYEILQECKAFRKESEAAVLVELEAS